MNLEDLRAKLVQLDFLAGTDSCELADVRRMLCERFDAIDFAAAKSDVLPFIKNPRELDLWSADFFKAIANDLRAE